MEECGCRCISKSDSNDRKSHLIFLGAFLERCGWVWDSKREGPPMGESLDEKYGTEGDSSGEISGG